MFKKRISVRPIFPPCSSLLLGFRKYIEKCPFCKYTYFRSFVFCTLVDVEFPGLASGCLFFFVPFLSFKTVVEILDRFRTHV